MPEIAAATVFVESAVSFSAIEMSRRELSTWWEYLNDDDWRALVESLRRTTRTLREMDACGLAPVCDALEEVTHTRRKRLESHRPLGKIPVK